jgi:hypothetical protein
VVKAAMAKAATTQDDVVPHDGTWNTDNLIIGESLTHDEEAKIISGVQKSEEMKKRRALC